MTKRQFEKEFLDNGVLTLKCAMLAIAVILAYQGHALMPIMIALKEVVELLLFSIRILHERKYHDVLHD